MTQRNKFNSKQWVYKMWARGRWQLKIVSKNGIFEPFLRGTWRMSRARRIALGAIGKWRSSWTFFTHQMTITSRARFLPLFFSHLSLDDMKYKRHTGEIYNTFASIYAVGCLLHLSTTIIVSIPPEWLAITIILVLSLVEMSSITHRLLFQIGAKKDTAFKLNLFLWVILHISNSA